MPSSPSHFFIEKYQLFNFIVFNKKLKTNKQTNKQIKKKHALSSPFKGEVINTIRFWIGLILIMHWYLSNVLIFVNKNIRTNKQTKKNKKKMYGMNAGMGGLHIRALNFFLGIISKVYDMKQ